MTQIKLGIASDLHTDLWNIDDVLTISPMLVENTKDADIILLAGDIGSGSQAVRVASFLFPNKPICMVAGNHEFYDGIHSEILQEIADATEGTNVTFLNRSTYKTDAFGTPLRIIGATLWTDFDLYGTQFLSMAQAGQRTSHQWGFTTKYPDFYSIYKTDTEAVIPNDMLAWHLEDRAWIQQELDTPFDGLTVLMTHHAPVSFAIQPHFDGSVISPCFASRLENMVIRDDLPLVVWGHVHYSLDRTIEKTRFVSNQIGYLGRELGIRTYTETGDFGATVVLDF